MHQTVIFSAGEEMQTIAVPIIKDYNWGKGAHFFVQLEKSWSEEASADCVVDDKFGKAKIEMSAEKHEAVFVWTEAEVQCVSSDSHAILYLQRIKEFDVQKTVRISTHEITGPDAAEDGKHYMPMDKKPFTFE